MGDLSIRYEMGRTIITTNKHFNWSHKQHYSVKISLS